MANNVKSTLESLESQYRILISEIDDCTDKGHLIKRQELLKKVSVVCRKIRDLETPISKTNGEQQTHKPDWVDIVNKEHAIEIAQKREEEDLESEPKITTINSPNNSNWSLGDIIFFFIALIIFIVVIHYFLDKR